LLQPKRLEQGRKRRNDAVQRPTPALPAFDPLPRLRLAEVEEMRMPAAHLDLEILGHLRGREFLPLLRDHQLKGKVKQQIAQLTANDIALALAERVVELQHLLDQVRTQGLPG